MEKLEKDFTLKTEKLNLDEEFGGALWGLAGDVWLNDGSVNVVKKELKGNNNMTVTMGCVVTTILDKYIENWKLKNLSPKNQEFVNLIVNNWRWEWVSEMYSNNENWCREKVKNILDNIR